MIIFYLPSKYFNRRCKKYQEYIWEYVMDSKLKKLSITMLWIIRLLIVGLPLLYILVWLFPDNSFSMNAVINPSLGNHLPGKLELNNRLLGIIGSLVCSLPLWIGFLWLSRLFSNYAQGIIFTLGNARIYSRLGWLCIISALLVQPLTDSIFSMAATINNPPGQRIIAFGFTNTNSTAIVCGIFLIIVARVMVIGHRINEEQQLTI